MLLSDVLLTLNWGYGETGKLKEHTVFSLLLLLLKVLARYGDRILREYSVDDHAALHVDGMSRHADTCISMVHVRGNRSDASCVALPFLVNWRALGVHECACNVPMV